MWNSDTHFAASIQIMQALCLGGKCCTQYSMSKYSLLKYRLVIILPTTMLCCPQVLTWTSQHNVFTARDRNLIFNRMLVCEWLGDDRLVTSAAAYLHTKSRSYESGKIKHLCSLISREALRSHSTCIIWVRPCKDTHGKHYNLILLVSYEPVHTKTL